MKYKVRPGIVRADICGAHLLIPNREASEACPHVMSISLLTAGLWEGLSKSNSTENIYKLYKILLNKPDEEIRQIVDKQLLKLYEKGFLLQAEDET